MVNSNVSALGIIFPNSYDTLVPELVTERLMASIPFASRYRLIDFTLSSMVNSGIDNVSVIVRKNYHSLMDHLGSGREWDLTRKNGGLNIVPPFAQRTTKSYSGRVDAIASILGYLKHSKEKYVILANANIAAPFDFADMIQKHRESEADVTVAYKKMPIPSRLLASDNLNKEQYYSYKIEDGRVKEIEINSKEEGEKNYALCIYVFDREFLIKEITETFQKGLVHMERDILIPQIAELNIQAYEVTGYTSVITDIKSYFEENMKLLEDENRDALFAGSVYTKIRDDNPTAYYPSSKVKNTMAADGCTIKGEVENSVLFRGVKVGKGAVVKNCVIMQDTVIEDGAKLEYVITDKDVTITSGKELKGNDSYPVFVPKAQTV